MQKHGGNIKMKNRIFAYVSAPTGESFANAKLRSYCRQLYDLGYLPVCPMLMFSRFLDGELPEEREDGRTMFMELLRRCRVLVVGSNEITGDMEKEILLAKRLGIVATTLAGIKKLSLQAEKDGE